MIITKHKDRSLTIALILLAPPVFVVLWLIYQAFVAFG